MSSRRTAPVYLLLLAVLAATLVLSVLVGASSLSTSDLWHAFTGRFNPRALSEQEQLADTILWSIRLPRTLVAALCGGALAAAGATSQGLFRNGLASPSVLGTESGGAFAAALVFYVGAAGWHWLTMPVAAFTGCLLATSTLFIMASRLKTPSMEFLLLIGFAFNALASAMTSLVVALTLEDYQKAQGIMHWLLGGFDGKGYEHVLMALPPLVLGLVWVLSLAPRLDVLSLGEDLASTLSVDIRKLRMHAIAAVALLVGTAVAVAGAIPFIGLVVPHFTRLIVGPAHRRLLVASTINGMSLMLLADLAARTVRAPAELEVGILTSLLGAPFFLWLLWSRQRRGAT